MHKFLLASLALTCTVAAVCVTRTSNKDLQADGKTIPINGCLEETEGLTTAKEVAILSYPLPLLQRANLNNLSRVTWLKLSFNNLTYITPGSFDHLNDLENLQVQHNQLQVLSRGTLRNLQVTAIHFQANKISLIEKEAFSNLPKLGILNLSDNLLEEWDQKWVKGAPELNYLYLDNNLIREVKANAFAQFENLKSITLAKNKICTVHPEAFQGLRMEYLNLSNNKLKIIHPDTFKGIFVQSKEPRLILQQNHLMFLTENTLSSLTKIKYLTLLGNPWTCPCWNQIATWANERKVKIDVYHHGYNHQTAPVCVATLQNQDECGERMDSESLHYFFLISKIPYEDCV